MQQIDDATDAEASEAASLDEVRALIARTVPSRGVALERMSVRAAREVSFQGTGDEASFACSLEEPTPAGSRCVVMAVGQDRRSGDLETRRLLIMATPGESLEELERALVDLSGELSVAVARATLPFLVSSPMLRLIIAEQRWGYLVLDRAGRIIEWNPHVRRLTRGLLGTSTWSSLLGLVNKMQHAGSQYRLVSTASGAVEVTLHRPASGGGVPRVLVLLKETCAVQRTDGNVQLATSSLPRRQREVVELLATTSLGLDQVAEQMGCATATARKHAERAYRKLGVRSRAALVALAFDIKSRS